MPYMQLTLIDLASHLYASVIQTDYGWALTKKCALKFWSILCLSQDNFWKPWRTKFIFAHPVHLTQYRSSLYMKVIGSRSQDRKVHNRYSRSGCLHVSFSAKQHTQQESVHASTAIFLTWPEVTSGNFCRWSCLRLEGNLVLLINSCFKCSMSSTLLYYHMPLSGKLLQYHTNLWQSHSKSSTHLR